jgi:hypothetical protein
VGSDRSQCHTVRHVRGLGSARGRARVPAAHLATAPAAGARCRAGGPHDRAPRPAARAGRAAARPAGGCRAAAAGPGGPDAWGQTKPSEGPVAAPTQRPSCPWAAGQMTAPDRPHQCQTGPGHRRGQAGSGGRADSRRGPGSDAHRDLTAARPGRPATRRGHRRLAELLVRSGGQLGRAARNWQPAGLRQDCPGLLSARLGVGRQASGGRPRGLARRIRWCSARRLAAGRGGRARTNRAVRQPHGGEQSGGPSHRVPDPGCAARPPRGRRPAPGRHAADPAEVPAARPRCRSAGTRHQTAASDAPRG